MSKWVLLVCLAIVLVVIFGCGSDNGTKPTPHNVTVAIEPAAFTQGVGLVVTFSATVTGSTNTAVSWSVNGVAGGDSATVGSIAATGRFRAPDGVPLPATVVVKATSVADPAASDSVLVTVVSGNGTGLPATYSEGLEQPLEGPIFHGWWDDCAGTDHNFYQGQCTPVVDSPVDWADGTGWAVSWTGQLFVPFTGNYRFASRYWVDGNVHILVNNTLITNLNTTGDSYDTTIPLTGNTWVPVFMTFQPNGGSNNMHLAWVTPGGEWCPVARSYLKP